MATVLQVTAPITRMESQICCVRINWLRTYSSQSRMRDIRNKKSKISVFGVFRPAHWDDRLWWCNLIVFGSLLKWNGYKTLVWSDNVKGPNQRQVPSILGWPWRRHWKRMRQRDPSYTTAKNLLMSRKEWCFVNRRVGVWSRQSTIVQLHIKLDLTQYPILSHTGVWKY